MYGLSPALPRRNTRQRSAIRDVFEHAERPLTVEEAHAALLARVPRAGIATVYRTVAAMVAQGRLVAVEMPGEPVRYERAGIAHHHHFRCEACRRVFDLSGCIEGLRALAPPRFRVRDHSVTLYGTCANCGPA